MNQSQMTSQKPKIRPWLWIVLIIVVLGAAGYYAWYFFMGPGKTVETSTTTEESTPSTTVTTPSTSTDEATIKKIVCEEAFPDYKYSSDLGKIAVGENYCQVDKLSGDYATGIIAMKADEQGGGPGAHWLATKVNNQWTKIQETQDAWDCLVLRKYNVPEAILGVDVTCYNPDTNKEEDY